MSISPVMQRHIDAFNTVLDASHQTVPEDAAAEEEENVEAWGCVYAKVQVRDRTLISGDAGVIPLVD